MSPGPGWYPDPGGETNLYRYWDGSSWSLVTSANPASPAPGTTLVPHAPVSPYPARRRSAAGWFIGGGALLLVLIVVVVLSLRSLAGGISTAGPTPGAPPSALSCPEAEAPTASPVPQTGDRVSSGRLSYPRLPPPFGAPEWDHRVPFGRDVQVQDAVVESGPGNKPIWVSSVLIARLLAGDGFFGPQQGAQVVAACVVGKFYSDAPVQRHDVQNAGVTIDGHQAWKIESHLTFQVPNVKTTGEIMIIVVVDTGNGEAGLFYASVPDTSPQFLQPSRRALADLKVSS